MSRLIAMLMLGAMMTACGPKAEPAKPAEPQGREETRSIRNTENIGYSGDAIANKVDNALNASEAQAQQMKDAEAAANPQQ